MLDYILKLIGPLGDFYLSRPSILIQESSDFGVLVVADSKCNAGCSTLDGEREFTFKLYINGQGSLDTAFKVMARIEAALQPACDGEEVLLFRRVFDESALVYKVKSNWSLRIINVESQYECDRILTLELKLTLVPAVQNLRTPPPITMSISLPPPTVMVDTTIAPSPVAMAISFPAPSILIAIDMPEPITLAISFPAFVRDLGGVDVAAGTASYMYLPAKKKLWSGLIDLDTDDIRALLVMTSTTADTLEETEFVSGFSTLDEFNGVGYTAGGVALTGEAVNQDTPNARAEFDADDTAFGALSNGTRQITGVVLYKFVTTYADSPVICYMNFSNFNPAGGALTLEWNVEGIFHQT